MKKYMPHISEHALQSCCVRWFRMQYPDLAEVLRAIPNGGQRSAITGAMLKGEGVVAGTADLILFVARNGYHSLHIEMKTPVGRQSESQRAYERAVTAQGNLYVICRTIEEFITTIKNYLR
jgi:hypothetical protein